MNHYTSGYVIFAKRKSSPNTWNLQKKSYMLSIHSQTERIATCQIDRSEKDIERIKKNILLRDYLKNIRRINKNNSIGINQGRNAETYCTSFPRFFIPRLSISSFLCLFIYPRLSISSFLSLFISSFFHFFPFPNKRIHHIIVDLLNICSLILFIYFSITDPIDFLFGYPFQMSRYIECQDHWMQPETGQVQ